MRQVAIIFIQLLEAGVGIHVTNNDNSKNDTTNDSKNDSKNTSKNTTKNDSRNTSKNESKDEVTNETENQNESKELTPIANTKKLFEIDTTPHYDRYSVEDNWDSFTATQILLIRDSIFSVLRTCVCLREYPVTVLIVWNIQVRSHLVLTLFFSLLLLSLC
jgi:hypothetical protein